MSTESQHQIGFLVWFRLKYPGVLIFAIPNGGKRDIKTASRLQPASERVMQPVYRGIYREFQEYASKESKTSIFISIPKFIQLIKKRGIYTIPHAQRFLLDVILKDRRYSPVKCSKALIEIGNTKIGDYLYHENFGYISHVRINQQEQQP